LHENHEIEISEESGSKGDKHIAASMYGIWGGPITRLNFKIFFRLSESNIPRTVQIDLKLVFYYIQLIGH
jgi:hypothetical protein